MLTDEEKHKIAENYTKTFALYQFASGGLIKTPPPYIPQKLVCIYALEMNNGIVKIGVTTNLEKRIQGVKGFLDVIRVHSTNFAPRSFMYDLEKRLHAVFEKHRVRSEYFAITFEEAVAELDSHADEIADALKKADEKTIEEINYIFNELLPAIRKKGFYSVDGIFEDKEKIDRLIKLASLTKNPLLREGLIRQAATLLSGKDIAEIEKNSSQNFIENFIDKFCVRTPKDSITRHDFLEKLRIECSEETAKLTDNALTSATGKINGINYAYDKLGNRSFRGIKWCV